MSSEMSCIPLTSALSPDPVEGEGDSISARSECASASLQNSVTAFCGKRLRKAASAARPSRP
jgi:hypothetical protein